MESYCHQEMVRALFNSEEDELDGPQPIRLSYFVLKYRHEAAQPLSFLGHIP